VEDGNCPATVMGAKARKQFRVWSEELRVNVVITFNLYLATFNCFKTTGGFETAGKAGK